MLMNLYSLEKLQKSWLTIHLCVINIIVQLFGNSCLVAHGIAVVGGAEHGDTLPVVSHLVTLVLQNPTVSECVLEREKEWQWEKSRERKRDEREIEKER